MVKLKSLTLGSGEAIELQKSLVKNKHGRSSLLDKIWSYSPVLITLLCIFCKITHH